MNKSLSVIATLIFSLYLTGCASNANDDVTARDRDAAEITRVNYTTPNQVGPAISGADTTDPELDRDRNYNSITNVRNDNYAGHNHAKTRVSDIAADRVTDLATVEDATIIVIDNNAYVAAKLHRSAQNDLNSDIQNKIARKVKSVDDEIDNVYISVNPDFYNRMKTYSDDIRSGRPVSGFMDEFSDSIRRMFPNAK